MMDEKKDLVWVEKEFAIKYKELEIDKSKREERLKIFNEYMERISKEATEQLSASYALWEKFDKEKPVIAAKTKKLIDVLIPLQEKLGKIEELMKKIDTYAIDKVIASITHLNRLYGKNKKKIEFLVKNFK